MDSQNNFSAEPLRLDVCASIHKDFDKSVELYKRNLRLKKCLTMLFRGAIVLTLMWLAANYMLGIKHDNSFLFGWYFAIVAGVPLAFVQNGRHCLGGYIILLKKMVESPHKLYLPALIDAYSFEWVQRDATFVAATSLLLQQVDGNDNNLLSASQKHKLWHYAIKLYRGDPKQYRELVVSALNAMTYFGSADMLRSIRQFEKTVEKHDATLLHIVQKHINILEKHLQSESVPQTLLRASVPGTRPDILLRPVSGTAQAAPEETAQLLRAAAGQDDGPNA